MSSKNYTDTFTLFYKIIRDINPVDLVKILTMNIKIEEIVEFEEAFKKKYGNYKGWPHTTSVNKTSLDFSDVYISDTGFSLLVPKERALELEKIFKGWRIYTNVGCQWYGGNYYTVGFAYNRDCFLKVYNSYCRNYKIDDILNI